VQELLGLLKGAGHTGFQDAPSPMGLTQRQAVGQFTRDEAVAFIDQLQNSEADADVPVAAPASPGRQRGGLEGETHGSTLGPVGSLAQLGDTVRMADRNVLGGALEPCGTDPLTGFYRDGCCTSGPEDRGSHTICAVVTAEFLDHQRRIGNDLTTPMPRHGFPGLVPGDRWCVTAGNWLRAHNDGAGAHVVLASTHELALQIVPLSALREHAVDVPSSPSGLEE